MPSPEEVLPSPVNYEDWEETCPMGKYKMRTVCPTAQFMVGVRFLIYYKIKLKNELRKEFVMLNLAKMESLLGSGPNLRKCIYV